MEINASVYTLKDLNLSLQLFDSNLDIYFDDSERDEFIQFLKKPDCSYYLFSIKNETVACGGFHINKQGVGSLCWGMIKREHHRKGFGKQMSMYRIDQLKKLGAKIIRLSTSQYSVGFYQKLGFTITETFKNGFGENLDQIDLELQL